MYISLYMSIPLIPTTDLSLYFCTDTCIDNI